MGGGGGTGQGAPQAIRTRYSGILFRSRLEARWAVFFDALGVKWEYEREGYELPTGRYLPDFFLPSWGWVEIKGQEPTGHEVCLTWDLREATGSRVIILVGSPADLPDRWPHEDGFQADGDVDYLPCVCPNCRKFGFEYCGRGERVCAAGCCPDSDRRTYDAPEILRAISTVRSHRFWDPQKAA